MCMICYYFMVMVTDHRLLLRGCLAGSRATAHRWPDTRADTNWFLYPGGLGSSRCSCGCRPRCSPRCRAHSRADAAPWWPSTGKCRTTISWGWLAENLDSPYARRYPQFSRYVHSRGHPSSIPSRSTLAGAPGWTGSTRPRSFLISDGTSPSSTLNYCICTLLHPRHELLHLFKGVGFFKVYTFYGYRLL